MNTKQKQQGMYTPTPDKRTLLIILDEFSTNKDMPIEMAYIVKAVNCHEELLSTAKFLLANFHQHLSNKQSDAVEQLITKAEAI